MPHFVYKGDIPESQGIWSIIEYKIKLIRMYKNTCYHVMYRMGNEFFQ